MQSRLCEMQAKGLDQNVGRIAVLSKYINMRELIEVLMSNGNKIFRSNVDWIKLILDHIIKISMNKNWSKEQTWMESPD